MTHQRLPMMTWSAPPEQLGVILENAPDAIIITDSEGRIRLANAQAEAMFGYARDEMIEMPVDHLLPDRLRKSHATYRNDYAADPHTRPMGIGLDLLALRKDGTEFPVEISLSPLSTSEGFFTTTILRDITDRLRLSEERARLERETVARTEAEKAALIFRRLQGITDAALAHLSHPNMLEIVVERIRETMDKDVAALFLLEPDQPGLRMRSQSGLEIGSEDIQVPVGRGIAGHIAEERKPLILNDVRRSHLVDPRLHKKGIRSLVGAPLMLGTQLQGVVIVGSLRKGSFSEEDVQLLTLVAERVVLVLEQVRLLQAARREITERTRAEAELRLSEARTRAILETAADGILSIDEDGIIHLFNPAAEQIFGYSAEEVIGKSVNMLMPSPVSKEHDGYIRRYLQTGRRRIIGIGREVTGLRKDGTEFPMDLAVSEVSQDDRRIFTGIIRDLTERSKMEQQLLQAQKMESIGRLAGGVAHDFNNLLTAILGYSELAGEALPPGSEERGFLDHIRKAALRAADLTQQLLAFARRQIIEPKFISLNDLMLDIDKMLRRLIGEDVELVTIPAGELWAIKADPSQISQIIMNLAVNARDAMPTGGKLIIETANVLLDEEYSRQHVGVSAGDYVMLAVSDTGEGMSEEVRAHLFEPFFTTKAHGKGTGLGLATCFGIVKQSGGHIWVYSEPGHGTTFKIYLPRAGEAAALVAREEPDALPRGSETILLAEDEPLVRDIAAYTLRSQGYTVLEAANGEEALRVVRAHPGHMDLLITDVVMPRMGGTELADRLARIHPKIRVLYTSGYTDNAIVQHGVLEPGMRFLHKPFTPAAFARKVREVLDTPFRPDDE